MTQRNVRQCLVTREKHLKDDLLRFALLSDTEVVFDKEKNIQSRGAYILNDKDILDKIRTTKKVAGKLTIEQRKQIINLVVELDDE